MYTARKVGVVESCFLLLKARAPGESLYHIFFHCCCRLLVCLLLQQWVPTLAGLSLIPLFPVLDEPAEDLIESVFDRLWPLPKVDGFVRKQVRHVVARLRKQLEGWAEQLEQLE
jgi:hypothetical protein